MCGGQEQELVQIGTNAALRFQPAFVVKRSRLCAACDHCVGDMCQITETKHPGKSSISRGIQDPLHRCPLPEPKWIEEPQTCQSCRRPRQMILPVFKVCKWCYEEIKVKQSNAKPPGGGNYQYSYRDFSISPKPFSSDPIRHLHFFLYPRYLESTLWHLDRLKRSIGTFNGQRVCCVATDEKTIQDEIRDRLEKTFTTVYYKPNDPAKRETVGFVSSLDLLNSSNENEVICFAHGKGQQHGTSVCPLIRKWIETSYETVVENWDEVRPAMEAGYPLAGSFKLLGSFRTTQYKWHYSGSYWWGRSSSIFSNPGWRKACNHWWGSESYVGRHWHPSEGHCLFADKITMGSPYIHSTWTNRLDAELEQWRINKHVTAE